MSAAQIAQLQARLDAYLAAEQRALEAQEFAIGTGSTNRRKVNASLWVLHQQIDALRGQIAALQNAGRRVSYLQPLR
jgi:hypothetical protein